MRCPRCGEPVSQFAAGCAICGADLEAAQAARPERRMPAVSVPRGRLPRDWWMLPVSALLALAFPLAGALLAGFAARQRDLSGERGMRNAFVAVAVAAVAVLLIPSLRFGAARLLYGV
jgi:hypothetical protein